MFPEATHPLFAHGLLHDAQCLGRIAAIHHTLRPAAHRGAQAGRQLIRSQLMSHPAPSRSVTQQHTRPTRTDTEGGCQQWGESEH